MDVISEFLSLHPVTTSMDWRCELHAPWKLVNEGTPSGIAPFHLVAEGKAWLETQNGKEICLEAGDLLMLPRGTPHILHAGSKAGPAPELFPSVTAARGLIRVHGTGARTEILCGEFHLDPALSRVLIDALPDIVLLKTRKRDEHNELYQLMLILKKETQRSLPGARVIVEHLSGALFSFLIRGYIQEGRPPASLLRLLAEPRIHPALQALLKSPEYTHTLHSLASLCHMSRATFIRVFTSLAGEPPGQVISMLRMLHAAKLLKTDNKGIGSISEAVGFASHPAFYRAFRRYMGMSPGEFRKRQKRMD